MFNLNYSWEIALICLSPALVLLIFPSISYPLKALLSILTATYLTFVSTVNAGWIIDMYHYSSGVDTKGVIFFISFIYGSFLTIFSGLTVLAIFVSKNETASSIMSKIFKGN